MTPLAHVARAGTDPVSSIKAVEPALLMPEVALPAILVMGCSTEPLPARGGGHRHMIRISENINEMALN